MTLQEFQHLVIGTHSGPTGAGPPQKKSKRVFQHGRRLGSFFLDAEINEGILRVGVYKRCFVEGDHCSPH